MTKRQIFETAQDRSLAVFHRVGKLPGYEAIDEDTAIALVSAYTKEFESYESTRARVREIVDIVYRFDELAIDRDWLLEVLRAPVMLGYEE